MFLACVASSLAFGQVVDQPVGQAVNQPITEQPFRPISRVVNLLKDMQKTTDEERQKDEELYNKMACWCTTNQKQKTKALEEYESSINRLNADIASYAAKSGELTQEIKNLGTEIEKTNKSIETAQGVRQEEATAFEAEKTDIIETIEALTQAVKALSGVHGEGRPSEGQAEEVKESLMQVKTRIANLSTTSPSLFRDVAEKDLWDALGSLDEASGVRQLSATQVLSEVFMAPVQKHEPSLVQAPTGAVAAKSYNSRSGAIYGMLKEMNDEFGRKLKNAKEEEKAALEEFGKLKIALFDKIKAATDAKNQKTTELSNTNMSNAQAKHELANTTKAQDEDTKFLANLNERCATSDKEYAQRQQTRAEEIKAISDTIAILTEDIARDITTRTVGFTQVNAGQALRYRAANHIRSIARRHHNMQLASLAVNLKLDSFTKVKKAMDDMIEGLKKEQQDEYDHREFCVKELDTNEDSIADKNRHKSDVESEIQDSENFVDTTKDEIKDLNAQIADLRTELKRAGEDRAAENKEFQKTVADQRATKQILDKALKRLEEFYQPPSATQAPIPTALEQNTPGRAEGAPPQQMKYEKHGSSGGVLELLRNIIADADRLESEAMHDEQEAQTTYAEFTSNTNGSIKTHQESIVAKSEAVAQAEVKLSESRGDLNSTMDTLEKLMNLNGQLHVSCDFVLKNFDSRQTARMQEIESIQEAKAIISGAK